MKTLRERIKRNKNWKGFLWVGGLLSAVAMAGSPAIYFNCQGGIGAWLLFMLVLLIAAVAWVIALIVTLVFIGGKREYVAGMLAGLGLAALIMALIGFEIGIGSC